MQQVEARVGGGGASVREETLTSYAFTGPAPVVMVSYGLLLRDRHALGLALRLGIAPMWSRAGVRGAFLPHELALGYACTLRELPPRTFALGAMLRDSNEVAYFGEWDDSHGYWLASLMLGPELRYAERFGKTLALETRAELGLVGLRSRSPARRLNHQDALNHAGYYFNRLARDPDLTWFWDTTQLRAEVLLRFRKHAERFGSGWAVGFEMRFARARSPGPYTSWYNGLVGSYGWSSR